MTGTKNKNGIKTKSSVIIASAPEVHHNKLEEIVGNHDHETYASLNYSAQDAFENVETNIPSPVRQGLYF